jgi:hypothetical protein
MPGEFETHYSFMKQFTIPVSLFAGLIATTVLEPNFPNR